MAKIYESIKGLVTSEMVTKAAETLGEDKNKVSSAISVLIPSLLGVMVKKGYNVKLDTIATEAGMAKLIHRKEELFEGHGILDHVNYGERFENALITLKDHQFLSKVAAKSGLKFEHADRLCNWVSGIIAGWFGEQIVQHKMTLNALIGQLKSEKAGFMADIPDEVAQKMGIGKGKKKKMGWLWWLLALILLLLLFCWWRSCKRAEVVPVAVEQPVKAAEEAWDKEKGERIELTLPNGEKIFVYKDAFEHKVLDFLNSDDYKNATNEQLRHIWFEFDNIEFKHDSATEFMPGSEAQLNNLITILKSHPDPKMLIGGYADKTGAENYNMELSIERAKYIRERFVQAGINAARLSVEGFGEEFATQPVTASDAERAIDRSLGIGFHK